jgi:hypothetical protein
MESLYDLHSWSKQYREEALGEARKRDLLARARVGRQRRSGRSRVGLAWASVLSMLDGPRF